MEIVLSLKDVSYKNVLKKVTFDLKKNTFNTLVGPNGCGKSTLINCIINQVEYQGSIYVSDYKKLKIMDPSLVLTQELAIDNITKSFENLHYEPKEARTRAYELSKKLGITDLVFKEQDSLLYSEKKAVLFACVVAGEPEILIIDDPLDMKNEYREKAIEYLKKASKNCTILFITNNENDLLLTDNIILMNEGTIINYNTRDIIFSCEKDLQKCNISLPFICDLSNRLKFYNLIKENHFDYDSLIEELWK